jgi:dihydrofolate reductase
MGDGGEGLHEWAFGDDQRDREALTSGVGTLGAVMGGAETGQQYLGAGLVDELSIHLVPVLFGSGTRMFDNLGDQHIQLEPADVIQTAAATHLRFRIAK